MCHNTKQIKRSRNSKKKKKKALHSSLEIKLNIFYVNTCKFIDRRGNDI